MTILEQIVATKRTELARAKRARPLERIKPALAHIEPARDFLGAVWGGDDEIRLIAEIKRASPSAGLICPDVDPVEIARMYHSHGAAALSVLTDETYFRGRLGFIDAVWRAVPLPVLRKDFIIDAYQVYESRAAGADAILLIAEAIGPETVAELVPVAGEVGLGVLVEVHRVENLEAVVARLGTPGPGRYLLGINNRDLTRQVTDLTTMERLAERLPAGARFVAESGIRSRADVLAARRAGACAVLVGESILKSPDMGAAIDELLGRGPEAAS